MSYSRREGIERVMRSVLVRSGHDTEQMHWSPILAIARLVLYILLHSKHRIKEPSDVMLVSCLITVHILSIRIKLKGSSTRQCSDYINPTSTSTIRPSLLVLGPARVPSVYGGGGDPVLVALINLQSQQLFYAES